MFVSQLPCSMTSQIPTESISLSPSLQLQELIKEMAQIEKVELHFHIGGSWPLSYLKSIADPQLFAELLHVLEQINEVINYDDGFKVFALISKIVKTTQHVEDGIVAICDELSKDRVTYAEFRTGLKKLEDASDLESHLQAVLRGIKRGTAQNPLKVGLILSLRRDTSKADADKIIELATKYRHEGIIGIDLSGNSTIGNGSQIWPALELAKAHDFPITLHIGESEKETPQQQMHELKTLNPQRIGHGALLCDTAKEFIRNQKIPVELCLTSALKFSMIKKPEEHFALELLREDHPVVICTDDPLILQVSLSDECARIAQLLGISKNQIQELQEKALKYAFANKSQ